MPHAIYDDIIKKNNVFADLIDSKANGLQVQAFFSQFSSVLLHQRDDHTASIITISIVQQKLELRVGPKCVCRLET